MVFVKAGDGVNTDLKDGAAGAVGTDLTVELWISEAESIINCDTTYNWTDKYSSLNVDIKYILQSCSSCLAAIQCIRYDMSGYTSRTEAEDMINVLKNRADSDLKVLKEKRNQDFILGA